MSQTLTFDPFGPAHMAAALRLSQAAGWPHRPADWELVAGLSRGVAALDAGEVVATALATPFGPVAMANMIIVDERLRGRGLGRQVMEHALALADPQEWRLVATQSGLPLYRKLGFVETGLVHQHQGPVADLAAPEGIRWATTDDLPAIEAMDRAATGADRAGLLAALMAAGRVAIAGDEGYAVLRPFGRGQVAGPVIAADGGIARRLLAFLAAGHAGTFLRVDTTDGADLAGFLAGIGLDRVDTGIAMRRGEAPAPAGPFGRFALAAQALG